MLKAKSKKINFKWLAIGVTLVIAVAGCSFIFRNWRDVDPRIETIIENWRQIKDISYDVKIVKQKDQSESSLSETFKIFVKDRVKTRVEINSAGTQAVFVNDPSKKLSFIYFPASGQYYQTNSFAQGDASNNLKISSRLDDIYGQLGDSFKVVATETVNGQSALVLENKMQSGAAEKIWISEEKSFPLKFQNYDEKGELVYDIEFDNLSTDSLSDDLFAMPAEAQSTTLDDLLKTYRQK